MKNFLEELSLLLDKHNVMLYSENEIVILKDCNEYDGRVFNTGRRTLTTYDINLLIKENYSK